MALSNLPCALAAGSRLNKDHIYRLSAPKLQKSKLCFLLLSSPTPFVGFLDIPFITESCTVDKGQLTKRRFPPSSWSRSKSKRRTRKWSWMSSQTWPRNTPSRLFSSFFYAFFGRLTEVCESILKRLAWYQTLCSLFHFTIYCVSDCLVSKRPGERDKPKRT